MKHLLTAAAVGIGLAIFGLVPTAHATTEHCPDKDAGGPGANSLVLPAGTSFCVKASNQATGVLTADGSTSLIGYVQAAGIVNDQGQPHDVSYYVVYGSTTTAPTTSPTTTEPCTTGVTNELGECEPVGCCDEPDPSTSVATTLPECVTQIGVDIGDCETIVPDPEVTDPTTTVVDQSAPAPTTTTIQPVTQPGTLPATGGSGVLALVALMVLTGGGAALAIARR